YALGWDGYVYENVIQLATQGWSGWNRFGSQGCKSQPSADWKSSSELDVFCRSSDQAGSVQYAYWDGTSVHDWTPIPGAPSPSIYTAPGATAYLNAGNWQLRVYGR